MGFLLFLFFWPVILAFGIFVVILPFIPYTVLIHSLIWLGIGLLARHIFNKHRLFEKGKKHKKTWVRVLTDIARWVIRIDIVANIILAVGAVILAIVFVANEITPLF